MPKLRDHVRARTGGWSVESLRSNLAESCASATDSVYAPCCAEVLTIPNYRGTELMTDSLRVRCLIDAVPKCRKVIGRVAENCFSLPLHLYTHFRQKTFRRFCRVISPPPPTLQMKMCGKCGNPKPLDDFGKDPKRSYAGQYGRQSWCKQCFRIYLLAWNHRHRYQRNKQSREMNAKLRSEVLARYSRHGIPECTCCGEKTIEFLAIDHINGGGRQHRKVIGGHTYSWIKKNNFPHGFQTLCHNCNLARGMYRHCPHQLQ